jgi:hypothetical protein
MLSRKTTGNGSIQLALAEAGRLKRIITALEKTSPYKM